jgi:hypothetical protein
VKPVSKPFAQLEMTPDELALAKTFPRVKNQQTKEQEDLYAKMELFAAEGETIGILTLLLGEMLDLKVDDGLVTHVNDKTSAVINSVNPAYIDFMETSFAYLFGKKLIVSAGGLLGLDEINFNLLD